MCIYNINLDIVLNHKLRILIYTNLYLKNTKYEMPETNVENLAYESKMINIVIGKVHQIYTDVTSDDIARYVRQILAEDEYHRMKPTEVAKEVVAIIAGSPTRKKRRPSSKAPASKNICDYISNT